MPMHNAAAEGTKARRRHGAVGVESGGELMRGWESSEAMDEQIIDFDGKISHTLHQSIMYQLVDL
jgi:hypothetical protein